MLTQNRIVILQGDITDETSDAIVNATNTDLLLGLGVAAAISRKGGQSIADECAAHGPIELGGVALTKAGRLPAKWVIHAAAMHLGGRPCDDSIRRATYNSLRVAAEKKFSTISFPALGTGVGGYAPDVSARLMLGETIRFLDSREFPQAVRFVLFTHETKESFDLIFRELTA